MKQHAATRTVEEELQEGKCVHGATNATRLVMEDGIAGTVWAASAHTNEWCNI